MEKFTEAQLIASVTSYTLPGSFIIHFDSLTIVWWYQPTTNTSHRSFGTPDGEARRIVAQIGKSTLIINAYPPDRRRARLIEHLNLAMELLSLFSYWKISLHDIIRLGDDDNE